MCVCVRKPDYGSDKYWIAQVNVNMRDYIVENHDSSKEIPHSSHDDTKKLEWQKHRRFFFVTGKKIEYMYLYACVCMRFAPIWALFYMNTHAHRDTHTYTHICIYILYVYTCIINYMYSHIFTYVQTRRKKSRKLSVD